MTESQPDAEDFDSVGRYVTDTICAANPDYAQLPAAVLVDVVETNVQNARIYLHAVAHQSQPTSQELASLADAARRRVRQGVPLEGMLRAYRIGARAMWEKFSESRPDLDPHALTDYTLRYIDWVSSEAERAYLAERDNLLNSKLEATRLLLSRIVADDFHTADERNAAVRSLGLNPEQPHVTVVIGPTRRASTTVDALLLELLQTCRRLIPGATSALTRRGVVILVPAAATSGIEALVNQALRQSKAGPDDVSAGLSRPAPTAEGLAAAVHEAERARTLGEILFPKRGLHTYEATGFFDLFRQGTPVDTFVATVLGGLGGTERTSKVDLVHTLYVYFTLGMNRRAAASQLGIHPNTLDYRLRQAAKTSGVDLTSPERSFRFQLAVRLLPLCTQTAELEDKDELTQFLVE
ncbi:PucR family transcriptional regulator [Rhodococcus sp. JS3073]|uniref:PucR family transcriptional regulator n=1 Tax=Rhodococcus sp. JS3073 TaxID=3002901 RepID=UPI00228620FB|nr:PucR family transcriptional regulator [Rhodococcus sp. JS3073]WAM19419.1 helix-turn-helix domain-containing protein [Rhodococcus sp. JS3073]